MLFKETQQLADRTSQHLYALMSFSYVGAMLASNYALQYISYPAQVEPHCYFVATVINCYLSIVCFLSLVDKFFSCR